MLLWKDLTTDEKEKVTETYVYICECAEVRSRYETTNDNPNPIDEMGVQRCQFARLPDGYVEVII